MRMNKYLVICVHWVANLTFCGKYYFNGLFKSAVILKKIKQPIESREDTCSFTDLSTVAVSQFIFEKN